MFCPSKYIKLLSFLILAVFAVQIISGTASAQAPIELETSGKSKVQAQVGEFYLSLYGYASPFASIILIIDDVVIRTAVADEGGNFSITGVLIKKGFDGFCLQAVDFKRLGESLTCFNVPPATGSIEMRDIFLPPTIGLQRSQIEAGGDAVIFGYTMPGAQVIIHTSDICPPGRGKCKESSKTYQVVANEDGYYEVTIENLPAGSYSLFATATYKGEPSEQPSNTVKLVALPWWAQLLEWLKKIWKWLVELFTSLGLGPLLFLIPLIPLITWLILKIWPERFTWIYNSKLYAFFKPDQKKLHHAWFMGY